MPATFPLAPELRTRIGDDIAVGHGRNAIARRHGGPAGVVTKIARERGLQFANDSATWQATEAHRIDAANKLPERATELEDELFNALEEHRRRRVRKILKAIRKLDRHASWSTGHA